MRQVDILRCGDFQLLNNAAHIKLYGRLRIRPVMTCYCLLYSLIGVHTNKVIYPLYERTAIMYEHISTNEGHWLYKLRAHNGS